MDVERLGASPIGRLVPFTGPDPATHELVEGKAFLPEPLPRSLTLSTETWTRVNAATAGLARLDGAARLIPSPALLRRPALRREAQSTSALEGTYAPLADVLAADRDDQLRMSSELREILNFEEMAELAFSWPEERVLSLNMLGELQRILVRGTSGELSDAGGLRDRIVVIGSPGRGMSEARFFIPPPPGDQLRGGRRRPLELDQRTCGLAHRRAGGHGALPVRDPPSLLGRQWAAGSPVGDRPSLAWRPHPGATARRLTMVRASTRGLSGSPARVELWRRLG